MGEKIDDTNRRKLTWRAGGTECGKGCVLKTSHKEQRIWTGGRDVGGVWYRVTYQGGYVSFF